MTPNVLSLTEEQGAHDAHEQQLPGRGGRRRFCSAISTFSSRRLLAPAKCFFFIYSRKVPMTRLQFRTLVETRVETQTTP